MNNNMKSKYWLAFAALFCLINVFGQNKTLEFENKEFDIKNVTASVVKLDGQNVLKVVRDLNALRFDTSRLENTVDEPTYVKLKSLNFENGTIEIKVLSQIQNPSPFAQAQGFIGVCFRISENDTAFESIYLRPRVGRSDNQLFRNHTVQYFAYPNYKFQTLRKIAPEMYETAAPVGLKEWITMRIEVHGERAELFINDAKYSTLIVSKMKSSMKSGAIGLWVDIGTIGYFKDLKISN
jgi:hypothetical protein